MIGLVVVVAFLAGLAGYALVWWWRMALYGHGNWPVTAMLTVVFALALIQLAQVIKGVLS